MRLSLDFECLEWSGELPEKEQRENTPNREFNFPCHHLSPPEEERMLSRLPSRCRQPPSPELQQTEQISCCSLTELFLEIKTTAHSVDRKVESLYQALCPWTP